MRKKTDYPASIGPTSQTGATSERGTFALYRFASLDIQTLNVLQRLAVENSELLERITILEDECDRERKRATVLVDENR